MRSHPQTGRDEWSLGHADKVYPASKIAAIVAALGAEGVREEDALRGVDIDAHALQAPDTRVALAQVIQCYRNAAELSRQPFFAYQAGLGFHVTTYGMWGFAILSSTNFRQTMDFAVKYHALATPLADISFETGRETSFWGFTPVADPSVNATLYRFIVELQLGTHVALHRDVMGATFVPRKVQLAYEPPSNAPAYADLIGCPVEFSRPSNTMTFDSVWLDRKPLFGNVIAYSHVSRLCEELLSQLELMAGLAGRVRRLLLENRMRPMSLEVIARSLKLPPRTLRRKLLEEGTSFRKLSDDLRMRLAIQYLRDSNLTSDEIAQALGFSEPANFRQAFRRWTGVTPQEFRTQALHEAH